MEDSKLLKILVLGIILFLIIPQLNISPEQKSKLQTLSVLAFFSIADSDDCIDGTISYWELDKTPFDTLGINHATNHGSEFVNGKFGQAIRFNGLTYMDFPAIGDNNVAMWVKEGNGDFYFLAKSNGVYYVNGIKDSSKKVIPLENYFGSGMDITVDRVAFFNNLSEDKIKYLYNGGEICSKS